MKRTTSSAAYPNVVSHRLVTCLLKNEPFRLPLPVRLVSAFPVLDGLPARLIG